MLLQIELWHLITLLLAFFSCVGVFGKVLINQFEKRLTEKFKAQETIRLQSQKHWDEKFLALEQAVADELGRWRQLERDLMQLKADLPLAYVRRDDYVRNQTVIEAKIDAVALRIENLQLRGVIK